MSVVPEQCSSCGGGCGKDTCKTKNYSARPENPPNIYKNGRLKTRKEMNEDLSRQGKLR